MRIDINGTFCVFICIYKICNLFLKHVYVFHHTHIEKFIYYLFLIFIKSLVPNFLKFSANRDKFEFGLSLR